MTAGLIRLATVGGGDGDQATGGGLVVASRLEIAFGMGCKVRYVSTN